MSALVLALPDPLPPFVLDSDASGEDEGTVLSQVWPQGERVVAYFSKVLNKACVTQGELLATMSTIRHFK